MKLVCEQCRARYSIADSKVTGKAFKIQCRKCNSPIVVAASHQAGLGQAPGAEVMIDNSGYTASGEAIWYVMVGQEQVGPVEPAWIASQMSSGEVTEDSFVWREGLADWVRLGEQEELLYYLGGEASRGDHAGAIERDFSSALVSLDDQESAEGFPSTLTDDDAEGDSPFPASDPVVQSDGPAVGARNENSVLFSLSDLQDISGKKKKRDATKDETSGLIDLRALISSEDEADDEGASGRGRSATINAPIYMPMKKSGGMGLKIALAIVGGALVAVGAVFAWNMYSELQAIRTADPEGLEVATAPRPEAQPEAAAVDEEDEKGEGEDDSESAEAGADEEEADAEARTRAQREAVARRDPAPAQAPAPAARQTPPPTPAPATKAPAPARREREQVAQQRTPRREKAPATRQQPRGDDDISNLLDGLTGEGQATKTARREQVPATRGDRSRAPQAQRQRKAGGERPASPPAATGGRASLGRDDIRNVVRQNSAQIRRCYMAQPEPRTGGTVTVRFTINRTGAVGAAGITDGPVPPNSEVGRCVTGTVRRMKFPSFTGDPITISYPFILR